MNEDFERFCQQYEGRGRISNQRYRTMRNYFEQHWHRAYDPNEPITAMEAEEKQYIEILFTQDGMERLLARERQHEALMQRHNDVRAMLQEQMKEDQIRHQNAAVNQAYEKYRMLLNLVKDAYR